jgi:hypothetical protein
MDWDTPDSEEFCRADGYLVATFEMRAECHVVILAQSLQFCTV